MFKNIFKDLLLIIASAFIFCFAGFENHFPLTYDDTGGYLLSGFKGEVPTDRPIMYGLFLRHISLADSLWLVIFAQGLIVSYLIFLCFKYLLPIKLKPLWQVALVLLLTFCTGATINVSQLIPDVFTPVMILCMGLLLTCKLRTAEEVFVSIMLVFAISTHNSHGAIGIIILTAVTLIILIWKVGGTFWSTWRRLFKIWLLLLAGIFIIPTVHYFFNGHFRTNNSTHVFLMYKLLEMGILDDYLKHTCDQHHWKICAYKDSIPTNFIWDYNKSPLYKTGGWEANKGEYDSIIRDIFSSPRYLKMFVEKCFSNSLEQLVTYNVTDLRANTPNTSPYVHIKWFFPGDIRQLEYSAQFRGALDFNPINKRQIILIVLSGFILFMIFYVRGNQVSPPMSRLALVILVGIIANAIVCGSFSQVIPRYEVRVIWLLPLYAFLLLLEQRTIFSSVKKIMSGKEEPDI
ncbi:MAG TPA: hypothetical protein VE978_15905 [Chitinophagales bacterium]|nr:hypothetical protein [Chitinophagales bacterium]